MVVVKNDIKSWWDGNWFLSILIVSTSFLPYAYIAPQSSVIIRNQKRAYVYLYFEKDLLNIDFSRPFKQLTTVFAV